ncbi:MAG: hypothetical protein Tsb007_39660 [Rhizobacter sp.]
MTHADSVTVPYLLLWLNSGCNARCQTCEIWRDTTKTFISAAEIAAMADQWGPMGVTEVELCGEPTLHPELQAVCEAIHSRGIAIRFLSNGLRLQRFAPLVARFGKSLTVSLDGPPVIHDLVRNVPMAYQRLERGVAAVRELAPDIPIYGRCAVHKLNYRELQATVTTARSLGLTDLSFIGLDVSSPAFGREKLDEGIEIRVENLVIPQEDVDTLREQVEALICSETSAFESGFIRESPNVLRSVLTDYFAEHWDRSLGGDRTIRCNAPWTSAVIEPDGKVRPCWFLPPYGNLNDFKGGLEELLNTDISRAYRDSIDVNLHPACRACICPRNFVA